MKPARHSFSFTLFLLLTAGLAISFAAELKLATVFGDHAVLQRDAAVPVWGWADAGTEVAVEFAGQKKSAFADANGAWQVKLDVLKASTESRTLTVRGANTTIERQDILVGEVWLGSGQSNMAMLVDMAKDASKEHSTAILPNVRMFKEESAAAKDAQADAKGVWSVCSPDSVGKFSATLFFFGREIHKSLNVPVGLINSSVGGTPIESWIAPEAQQKSKELAPFLASLEQAGDEAPSERVMKRYKAQLAQWEAASKKAREAGEPLPRKPRDPAVAQKTKASRIALGGLFNGKIAPLIPYAIRGAVWYQGEANTKGSKPPFYQHQLPLLVSDWRARWGHEFPMAWVQLPNFTGEGNDWPTIREAQLKTLALPNTGMTTNMDIGEPNNIHPKNKQEIGRRLSLWALGSVYGQKVPATSGPLPAGHVVRGSEIVLSFTHTHGGLVARDGVLTGFVIAGEDKQWQPAQARIEGDKVIVSYPGLKQPVAARYSWENLPLCNLFNGAGLPASPFRTDDWK